jgi:hypothetical protein
MQGQGMPCRCWFWLLLLMVMLQLLLSLQLACAWIALLKLHELPQAASNGTIAVKQNFAGSCLEAALSRAQESQPTASVLQAVEAAAGRLTAAVPLQYAHLMQQSQLCSTAVEFEAESSAITVTLLQRHSPR